MQKELLNNVNRLKALADTGMIYASNEYDKERYTELQELSFHLLSTISGHPIDHVKECFPLVKDYPTAKVDIRGMVISPDQKILFVKETKVEDFFLLVLGFLHFVRR